MSASVSAIGPARSFDVLAGCIFVIENLCGKIGHGRVSFCHQHTRSSLLSQVHSRPSFQFEGRVFNLAAHHIVWYFFYGYWPKSEIDHEDRDRTNNCIFNLKPATSRQNGHNRSDQSPFGPGVCLRRTTFIARYFHGDTRYYLGTFKTPEDAQQAYVFAHHFFTSG